MPDGPTTRPHSTFDDEIRRRFAQASARAGDLSTMMLLTERYMRTGRFDEAESLWRSSLASQMEKFGGDHPEMVVSLFHLAQACRAQDRADEAAEYLQRALAVVEADVGVEHPALASIHARLAAVEFDRGRFDEAESRLLQALAVVEAAFGPDRPEVAEVRTDLGKFFLSRDRLEEAEEQIGHALRIYESTLGRIHPRTAVAQSNLAVVLRVRGRTEEAEALHRRAVAIAEEAGTPAETGVADLIENLAAFLAAMNRHDEAEAEDRRAMAIHEEIEGPESPEVALAMVRIANRLASQGKLAEAESMLESALAIEESALGSRHPAVAGTLGTMVAVRLGQGKLDEAEAASSRALDVLDRAGASVWSEAAEARIRHGDLLRSRKRPEEATRFYQEALDRLEAHPGADPRARGICLSRLMFALRDAGRLDEAEALGHRLLELVADPGNPGSDELDQAHHWLARIIAEQGRLDEAEAHFRREFDIHAASAAPEPDRLVAMLGNLVAINALVGRLGDARKYVARMIESISQTRGNDHPDLIPPLIRAADLAAEDNELSHAEAMLARALPIAETAVGRYSDEVASVITRQGVLHLKAGRHGPALFCFRRLLRIRRKFAGEEGTGLAWARLWMARARFARGEMLRAWWGYRSALATIVAIQGRDHVDTSPMLVALAQYHFIRSRYRTAASLLERNLTILDAAKGPGSDEAFAAALMLASILEKAGRVDKAIALHLKVRSRVVERFGPTHLSAAVINKRLGELYLGNGRLAQARVCFEDALHVATRVDPASTVARETAESLDALLRDLDDRQR